MKKTEAVLVLPSGVNPSDDEIANSLKFLIACSQTQSAKASSVIDLKLSGDASLVPRMPAMLWGADRVIVFDANASIR